MGSHVLCKMGENLGANLLFSHHSRVVLRSSGGLWPVYTLVLIFSFFLARFQDLEGAHECFVDRHHTASVVEFSAIIWRGEKRDKLAFREELVTVFHDLMGSTNKIKVVSIQKFRHHIGTECEAYSSVVLAPTLDVFVRI